MYIVTLLHYKRFMYINIITEFSFRTCFVPKKGLCILPVDVKCVMYFMWS